MTAALAAFAVSPSGKLYRHVCGLAGVDPAAVLPDDVDAWILRLALQAAKQGEPAEDEAEMTDLEREWLEAGRV